MYFQSWNKNALGKNQKKFDNALMALKQNYIVLIHKGALRMVSSTHPWEQFYSHAGQMIATWCDETLEFLATIENVSTSVRGFEVVKKESELSSPANFIDQFA